MQKQKLNSLINKEYLKPEDQINFESIATWRSELKYFQTGNLLYYKHILFFSIG